MSIAAPAGRRFTVRTALLGLVTLSGCDAKTPPAEQARAEEPRQPSRAGGIDPSAPGSSADHAAPSDGIAAPDRDGDEGRGVAPTPGVVVDTAAVASGGEAAEELPRGEMGLMGEAGGDASADPQAGTGASESAVTCPNYQLPRIEGSFAPPGSTMLLSIGKLQGVDFLDQMVAGFKGNQVIAQARHTQPSAGGGTDSMTVTYKQMVPIKDLSVFDGVAAKKAIENFKHLHGAGARVLEEKTIPAGSAEISSVALALDDEVHVLLVVPVPGRDAYQSVRIDIDGDINGGCAAEVQAFARAYLGKISYNAASTYAQLPEVAKL